MLSTPGTICANTGSMELAEKIRNLMAAKRIRSQRELAEITGISKSAINRWVTGQGVPSLKEGLLFARAVGVPLEFLADDEMERPPQANMTAQELALVALLRRLGADAIFTPTKGMSESEKERFDHEYHLLRLQVEWMDEAIQILGHRNEAGFVSFPAAEPSLPARREDEAGVEAKTPAAGTPSQAAGKDALSSDAPSIAIGSHDRPPVKRRTDSQDKPITKRGHIPER